MEFLFGAGILFFILWTLLVRGILWKLIIGAFAFIGMNSYLLSNFPNSRETFMTVLNYNISWAAAIPSVLILLALMTTSIKNQ